MPNPNADPHADDMTEAQAEANIAAHEKLHGQQMADSHRPSDLPDMAKDKAAGPPGWFKKDGDLPPGWKVSGDTFVEED